MNIDTFFGKMNDYLGFHYTANEYYKHKIIKWFYLIDVISIPLFPMQLILSYIINHCHMHYPNCNCELYKQIHKKD